MSRSSRGGHFDAFLTGVQQALTLQPSPRHYQDPSQGFASDRAALRSDCQRLGHDMRVAFRKASEQNAKG